MAKNKFQLTDKEIRQLVEDIHSGQYDPSTELPENVYYAIADYLKEGVFQGFGINLDDLTKLIEKGTKGAFTGKDLELLTDLRENIYMFSAAKTYATVKEMSDALTDDSGRVRSFREFKEIADDIAKTQFDSWLQAEYDTAISQGQNAIRWSHIELDKGTLPYLRYGGVEDANECEICYPLNNIVLPVDDPFWNEFAPSNHYKCRCVLEQLDEDGRVQVWEKGEVDKIGAQARERMQPVFLMNPGKDKVIFNEDHPYFSNVPKDDREFATTNFGLPIPGDDK